MDKLMVWMTDVFAPKVNKIVRNPWVAAVQEAMLTGMPMIFIGSFVTVFSLLRNYWTALPDLSMVSTFSFGLYSLFISYLLPEALMNKKGYKDAAKPAGLAGIAFFLMLIYPVFLKDGSMKVATPLLGTGGMLIALVGALFVAAVMNLASKYRIISEDSALPDFVATWFNTILPITIILLVGWFFTFQINFNLSAAIQLVLSPLIKVGGGFWGFIIITFLGYSFLYTFGISSWILYPIETAIALSGIANNVEQVKAGHAATHIFVSEAINLFTIGGGGATLALCLMMTFMAKSSRMKIIGRASIIPSLFNINEPVVFGAPIAFNPILMVPMWIMGIIGPVLTWFSMSLGVVPIPTKVFNLWYLPTPIYGWISTGSFRGCLLVIILFTLSWIIYLPFFKLADKEALKQQELDAEEE